jgi:hypothetical protein
MAKKEYEKIVQWGKGLGSADYYIKMMVEQARKDNAPEDAIYKRDDGTWARWNPKWETNEMPCPICGTWHGPHPLHVKCECGAVLQQIFPIYKQSHTGWVWRVHGFECPNCGHEVHKKEEEK